MMIQDITQIYFTVAAAIVLIYNSADISKLCSFLEVTVLDVTQVLCSST
jgi:hypothetical protein